MKRLPSLAALLLPILAAASGQAAAETFEVQMLNKGAEGAMVFEPAYVKAAPGDVIHFVPTDRSHNAASIDGMLPEGVEPFRSKMNKEFELTVEEEGLYGVKCQPHFGMGMVALIQVGAPVNREAVEAVKLKGKAAARFEPLLARVD
ncbi:MAG: pseudoazurin [Rhodobacteraceae bacterium]|nr:pseudoazurin [Paracoccaceae bacterium]MBR27455.1 pseudoazurin [Paracoccaceae bacterium]